ncbi:ribonuclease H family protein [Caldibacillus thermolactis]|jgi:ribonuclease HI|uniref:Ribonuclease H n=1 Tax=Pallidibacillus thermolactis TaxID=251051 RepID=A0ABT2WH95_9BACI|nr:ribonuclease H family protein [Pallidibacillus thermolactis]MCU9595071.1 ribonuclease H family protein [Pallidibacillus thermolactis]MCU9602363.1 ribonuclease H family protein [Pallidibacillus thermolactis subsp. kokeshiiformis]MED1674557.1 ribonuclease H family protein [Pallidibacillus thermolactis subsp. kokeshiiformis]
MAKQKYYVVWEGRKKGIYTSWNECKLNTEGIKGAKYKAFLSKAEAEAAYQLGWKHFYQSKSGIRNNIHNNKKHEFIAESISVDAACSGNPGLMEYQGVYTKTGQKLFHYGPIIGTNNIGEFLAIIHGLSYLKERNLSIPIYSDSQTAIKWVKMKKANTSLAITKDTEKVWDLIKRGEQWLKKNTYTNKILKWETEWWGENKADFGRK